MIGFIARETEKAVALVTLPIAGEASPMWVPRKKILSMVETGEKSSIQLKGEEIRRLAPQVEIEIEPEFLKKIGVA